VVKLINVGIIGLGKMGLLHAGIFNALENSKVTAIAEKNKFIVSALKNHIPKINMYTDYEKMFRKEDLDALVITTPVFLHKEMVFDAEDYGVNIFVEKPLAINGDECRSILNKKTDQKTSVGYCRRFLGTYQLVKKLIDESVLGPVNFFQSQIFVEQVFQKEKGWFYHLEKKT
jgi:predicted dehydrogenase